MPLRAFRSGCHEFKGAVFQRSLAYGHEGFQFGGSACGILKLREVLTDEYGERVGNANVMDMGMWLGSATAIIVMLAVSAIALVAFGFWIGRVQLGIVRTFVAAVMPASTINVVVVLVFLLATSGGLSDKGETTWFLITPFAVYSIVSLTLCVVLHTVYDARSSGLERVDSLMVSGTLAAYYAFLLVLYPIACGLYALMRPLSL